VFALHAVSGIRIIRPARVFVAIVSILTATAIFLLEIWKIQHLSVAFDVVALIGRLTSVPVTFASNGTRRDAAVKIYLIARVNRLTNFALIAAIVLRSVTSADVHDAMDVTRLLIVRHQMPSFRTHLDALDADSDMHPISHVLACDAIPAIPKQTVLGLPDPNLSD
jgi:hypothetical protein